ncbi:exodeoxyribonuclease VII small subunit [Streptomyces sp. 4503]|uniref:Exodeoxyribonuclease 7 small subunit n=1 Tax=Streptomyces niphimycinicus TaxID=2842201 RepID=A0ABS6CGK8_9ACTN|nr:exodeoxyribonuclease VII small subunit [Streptomyces niphimycinicus]MBU3866060.1 exodeoxyribonuclease VII small subunit [Streptomyces niphimycinicus]
MAKTDEQAQQSARGAQSAPRAETTLGYEQARDELVEVVRRLEAGGTSLEESLALWERGEELAKVCRRWLEGARARLDAALADETDEDEVGDGNGGGAEDAERGAAEG